MGQPVSYRCLPEPVTRDAMPDMAFIDMDGVLARYDWGIYLPDGTGVPPYMREELHVFRDCRPDPVALSILRAFVDAGVPSYILTGIRSDLPWVYYDKIYWLESHAPWFDPGRMIVAPGDKAQAAMAASKAGCITKKMLLLDDFNPNLWDWDRAGGCAVKYLNGVNSPGTSGLTEFDSRPWGPVP